MTNSITMIYIDKDTLTKLDKRFHNNHNIAVIIYDQHMEILADENYSAFKKFDFNIDRQKDKFIDELNAHKIDALDWFKLNNRTDELCTVLSRRIFMSILGDFCNFIYESLQAAMKGKMNVAYALLRKPLQDELLIFEQLLIDKKGFIDKFYHLGKPEHYDPSAWNKSLDKFQIISAAFAKLKNKFAMDKQIIYDLRFNKNSASGLYGITNRAIHLVTTAKEYRTEDQGLNFVFPSKEQHEEMWDHYYSLIPILLIYSSAIIDQLIQELIPINADIMTRKSFSRFIALVLMSGDLKENPLSQEMLNAVKRIFSFPCFKCEKEFEMELADLDLIFHSGYLLCPHCFEDISESPAFKQKVTEFASQLQS